MKLAKYIKDRYIDIVLFLVSILLILLIFYVFKINIYLIIFILTILIIPNIVSFVYQFLKKRQFYNSTLKILDNLDKKYLILEMIKKPNFEEGRLLYEMLYEIDKSMIEELNNYKYGINDFKEYLELWCHEIKTPVATTKLIIENNKSNVTSSIKEEVDKIDNYIEQVLYYSRSSNVENDYIISKINMERIIQNIIKKNKKDIINKKIKIEIKKLYNVNSDSKWITFIINQIIINSIKYSSDISPKITIYMKTLKNKKILYIEDNGIGIDSSEINRVFEKGFTGSNGRKKYNSTGIGLYLCKKLCDKLDHTIEIKSLINSGTTIMIVFPDNSLILK